MEVTEGQLYRYHEYARCDGCRSWWRKHVECRYVNVENPDPVTGLTAHGYPYQTMSGEHVRDLSEWERTKGAGSSFAVWTNYEWEAPERVRCPDCRAERLAAASQLTLEAPQITYTADQAGHYDNPPRPYAGPTTEEEALDQLVPAGFVAQLDTRAGTARVVELLKAAGVTRPKGAPWNWNRLANLCTHEALDLKYLADLGTAEVVEDDETPVDVEYADEEPSGQLALGIPGEQRALAGLAKPGKPAPTTIEED